MNSKDRKALIYILNAARAGLSKGQSYELAQIELIALIALDEEGRHVRMGHLNFDQERTIRARTREVLED